MSWRLALRLVPAEVRHLDDEAGGDDAADDNEVADDVAGAVSVADDEVFRL